MVNARNSSGKISLTVRYAALAAERNEENDAEHDAQSARAKSSVCEREQRCGTKFQPRHNALIIGLRPILSKEAPQSQSTQKAGNREWQ